MGRRSKNKFNQLPPAVKWAQNKLDPKWLDPWDLNVQAINWVSQDCWRIITDRGIKQLIKVNWPEERMLFIQGLLDHLGQAGFKTISRFIRTADDVGWLPIENGYVYLCDWVEGKPINLTEIEQLIQTTRTLAKLHSCIRNFKAPIESNRWDNRGRWPGFWRQSSKQVLAYRDRVENQRVLNLFDRTFIDNFEELYNQMQFALFLLDDSRYLEHLDLIREQPFVCHNSFREANLLLTSKNKIHVFGFEKCMYDLRVYELGRFLQRVLIQANWDISVGQKVLNTYEEEWSLSPVERQIMLAQLWFPYSSWTYVQYYYAGRREIPEKKLMLEMQREKSYQKSREQFLSWAYEWAR